MKIGQYFAIKLYAFTYLFDAIVSLSLEVTDIFIYMRSLKKVSSHSEDIRFQSLSRCTMHKDAVMYANLISVEENFVNIN